MLSPTEFHTEFHTEFPTQPGPAGVAIRPGEYDWKRIYDKGRSERVYDASMGNEFYVSCRTAVFSWQQIGEDSRDGYRWVFEFENIPTVPESPNLHELEEAKVDEVRLLSPTPFLSS